MPCHAMPCHAMLCYTISYYNTLYDSYDILVILQVITTTNNNNNNRALLPLELLALRVYGAQEHHDLRDLTSVCCVCVCAYDII